MPDNGTQFDVIDALDVLTVAEGTQMTVFESITIYGDLDVEGKVRVTA